jgi:hypothetical protein
VASVWPRFQRTEGRKGKSALVGEGLRCQQHVVRRLQGQSPFRQNQGSDRFVGSIGRRIGPPQQAGGADAETDEE